LGQQLSPRIANGSTIGPLNVKPFDGPILCDLNGFSNGIDGFHLTVEVQWSQLGPSFVIWVKENLGPFSFIRPKVLAPYLCHVGRHVGQEEVWVAPQYKTLGPNLKISSNPIG
jgi:hypothetical protein